MRYLFYHGPVNEPGVRNVETLISTAMTQGEREVTLCLSSGGGDVNAGIWLYNFIKMMPIDVHTHAAGVCFSITATILLAGKKRSASPTCGFSLHAARYSEGPLNGQISPNTTLIAQPFQQELGWTDEDVSKRFSAEDFRFGPEKAVELGVIHEIKHPILNFADMMITVRLPS